MNKLLMKDAFMTESVYVTIAATEMIGWSRYTYLQQVTGTIKTPIFSFSLRFYVGSQVRTGKRFSLAGLYTGFFFL